MPDCLSEGHEQRPCYREGEPCWCDGETLFSQSFIDRVGSEAAADLRLLADQTIAQAILRGRRR
jgi:hypothetical protein